MQPNSGYALIPIVKETDYTPMDITRSHGNTDIQIYAGKSNPIFALWCIESTDVGVVKIMSLGNDMPVTVPAGAFRQGVVYYMYLKQLVEDAGGKVKFIGYQYATHPSIY